MKEQIRVEACLAIRLSQLAHTYISSNLPFLIMVKHITTARPASITALDEWTFDAQVLLLTTQLLRFEGKPFLVSASES